MACGQGMPTLEDLESHQGMKGHPSSHHHASGKTSFAEALLSGVETTATMSSWRLSSVKTTAPEKTTTTTTTTTPASTWFSRMLGGHGDAEASVEDEDADVDEVVEDIKAQIVLATSGNDVRDNRPARSCLLSWKHSHGDTEPDHILNHCNSNEGPLVCVFILPENEHPEWAYRVQATYNKCSMHPSVLHGASPLLFFNAGSGRFFQLSTSKDEDGCDVGNVPGALFNDQTWVSQTDFPYSMRRSVFCHNENVLREPEHKGVAEYRFLPFQHDLGKTFLDCNEIRQDVVSVFHYQCSHFREASHTHSHADQIRMCGPQLKP
ncbi:unnamed protein product [Amoebophrya sp. A120]|nr:unnamed protein product [Amoebophrya sp. A120]|eukprot:GSA120T00020345001.1